MTKYSDAKSQPNANKDDHLWIQDGVPRVSSAPHIVVGKLDAKVFLGKDPRHPSLAAADVLKEYSALRCGSVVPASDA